MIRTAAVPPAMITGMCLRTGRPREHSELKEVVDRPKRAVCLQEAALPRGDRLLQSVAPLLQRRRKNAIRLARLLAVNQLLHDVLGALVLRYALGFERQHARPLVCAAENHVRASHLHTRLRRCAHEGREDLVLCRLELPRVPERAVKDFASLAEEWRAPGSERVALLLL